jgi:hypothetical protein
MITGYNKPLKTFTSTTRQSKIWRISRNKINLLPEIGTRILIVKKWYKDTSHKFNRRFKGPYIVSKHRSDSTVDIESNNRKHNIINICHF